MTQTVTTAFVALHRGDPALGGNILVASPVIPFNAAYYNTSLSFNQEVDFYFEAGEFPGIEMGTPQTFAQTAWNRFNVSGYLVDLLP